MSQREQRYPVDDSLRQVCPLLGIKPDQLLRRAGLPADSFDAATRGVTGAQFFAIWDAMVDLAWRPGLIYEMARTFARGPFTPAMFAFSCSPDIATGISRLALFKPLVCPLILSYRQGADQAEIALRPKTDALIMPASLALFEVAFFHECSQNFAATSLTPVAVGLPEPLPDHEDPADYFGCPRFASDTPVLCLRPEDAALPLVSASEGIWAGIERELKQQLAERDRAAPMTQRVQAALLELLPAGRATADAVSSHLRLSKRSLQRHLRSEGRNFQAVLDATRSDLSLRYLRQDGLSVEEISYLLAYRDPNSFYRAFQGWTGMTPAEARMSVH